MATDREIARLAEKGMFGSTGMADIETCVNNRNQRVVSVLISDAATAGTAVTETVIAAIPVAAKIISVSVMAPIAVTASDSVYATFSVAKRTAAGATSTAIASQTTKTSGSGGLGSLTAFASNALTLTATTADLTLVAGAVLTVAVAKASTGTALTAATSYVTVTVVYQEV